MPGVLVGVLVFELMKVALQFMNVNSSYTYIVQGLVIIVLWPLISASTWQRSKPSLLWAVCLLGGRPLFFVHVCVLS